MNELELDRVYRRGEQGRDVRRIQEWLSLHGFAVAIDGDFGAATEAALKRFQAKAGLAVTGVGDAVTFDRLVAPLKAAVAPVPSQGRTLGSLVVAYATQHLRQRPREMGGENRGPWVRLYMDGNEGRPWAWCAGFSTFCLQQAARTMGVPMPVGRTLSCDTLASFAREKNRLVSTLTSPPDRTRICPGSLFLRRRTATDWVHTGIVTEVDEETFQTIEGNTNDDGSPDGYEVCARTRGFKDIDFVLI
ncbi:peptidoglycan-binding protein [Pyxidicoccus parkwayensis]|jgi:Putative peptidoglycan binding domain|uniref:Peptidoglycan-binding protein n=1 Tax=Pyxidicoccus parkwayensis TaxID=2813578 RepID=A0ABX7P9N4_9BACT|nr:peptidoglycan-binding protein [Pyxidicoccus parkwaysis]QSQ27181.1 peptidoglycan-binding protein [Pyxidicoccus parkwaysis]